MFNLTITDLKRSTWLEKHNLVALTKRFYESRSYQVLQFTSHSLLVLNLPTDK